MDDIVRMPLARLMELFTEAAFRYGSTAEVVEKDFWVTWTLKQIFALRHSPARLVFKGGTSLSKVYGLIQRFSEDIDLSLSREDLGFTKERDPYKASSRKKQDALVDELVRRCKQAIVEELLPSLRERFIYVLGDKVSGQHSWSLTLDPFDVQTIYFAYPSDAYKSTLTKSEYLKPFVRLEFGARSDQCPVENRLIRPILDEVIPSVIKAPWVEVNVLSAERTFWEKATLLHAEYHRPVEKGSRERLTRHYCDLVKLWSSPIGKNALNQVELLQAVVRHKKLFFRSAWANYESAKPGSFRLLPKEVMLPRLRSDYSKMQKVMIFGESPSFDELQETLKEIEDCINSLAA